MSDAPVRPAASPGTSHFDPNAGRRHDDRPLRRGSLTRSLFLWFLALALVPLLLTSAVSLYQSHQVLTEQTGRALLEAVVLKRSGLQHYLENRARDLLMESDLSGNVSFLEELNQAFGASGLPLDRFVRSFRYARIVSANRTDLDRFARVSDYYDILLLDSAGNILFSLRADANLGTNLFAGDERDSPLARAAREALEQGGVVFSDLMRYRPSDNALALFASHVMVNEAGERIGVMVMQLPYDRIDAIMSEYSGLGETGQTYLVGRDGLLRSRIRGGKASDILSRELETEAIAHWREQRAEVNGMPGDHGDFLHLHVSPGADGAQVVGVHTSLGRLEDYGLPWGMMAELTTAEAHVPTYRLLQLIGALLGFTMLSVTIMAYVATRRVVGPIRSIAEWARRLASGDLRRTVIAAPDNEIGTLNDSFLLLAGSLQELTETCRAIAVGELDRSVTIRGEYDVLARSVARINDNLREVANKANEVAQGHYSELRPRSEQDGLGLALAEMTRALRELTRTRERQEWLQSVQAEASDVMRGEPDLQALARKVTALLCKRLHAPVGGFFVVDEEDDGAARLLAGYAYRQRRQDGNRFAPGEGLVGQALLEQEIIQLSPVPPDYVHVASGLGESVPDTLLEVPLLYEDRVLGVLELGLLGRPREQDMELLTPLQRMIGTSINSLQSVRRTEQLLVRTREQAEELQTREEALRASNEELARQTRSLQASELRLQNQQEELRAANEELTEKSQALESQAEALRVSEEELKNQREELQASNEELTEKARMLEQQKAALNEARAEAERRTQEVEQANRYKSEFLANMSHELRTPLNSLLILSQDLAENGDGNLNEEQVEAAGIIHESGAHLLQLINEVLDLSKVEAGKMELLIEDVPLAELSDVWERQFRAQAGRKGIDFRIEIDPAAPATVRSDRQRMTQIVNNLLSNAFKFTERGEVRLRVAPTTGVLELEDGRRLPADGTLVFAVSDSGIGIPAARRESVFRAFEQVDGTTSRKYGGTGLGLAISRKLAALLGGGIDFDSREGAGSTFRFHLPTQPPQPARTDSAASPPERPAAAETDPPPAAGAAVDCPSGVSGDLDDIAPGEGFILVIEDDPGFARVLCDMAHGKGFKCVCVADGESGLRIAMSRRPTGIVLDVGLPAMDGWDVIERLKAAPQTRHVPVHFISGRDESVRGMEKGAVGFLTKPVSKEQILGALDKLAHFAEGGPKTLLVVADDDAARSAIGGIVGAQEVRIVEATSGAQALQRLAAETFDCLILDPDLPDISGFEVLAQAAAERPLPPVVIYSDRELSAEENLRLRAFTDSIVIRGARSPERLLDEVTLFLHSVHARLPLDQRRLLLAAHDREDAFDGRTVLIVDDDMRNTFALSRALRSKGLQVLMAQDGRKALDQIAAHPEVDLVLMDIMLPDMDGFETMRRIREDQGRRQLPILAVTAKAMPGDRARCLQAGANDYVTKPIDMDRLLSMMRLWMGS